MLEEPATEGELRHSLSVYERERDNLLSAIREARTEARRTAIESAACRQHIEQATIDRWQRRIKESQEQLMLVQTEIGAINKKLRALHNDSQPIKALSQVSREVAVNSTPPKLKDRCGEVKTGRVLFLEFFFQLCQEGLDPRQVAAFESGAHQLVDEFRKTHGKEETS
jgi:uncharacterized protein involved in tolerance to divalent cations